jgi:hypothetical protein
LRSALRSALTAAWLVCASLGGAACGELLGVNDYGNAPASAPDSGTPDAGAAGASGVFAAKPPWLSGEGCQECIAAQCAEQRDACASDAWCTRLYDRKREHPGVPGPVADYRQRHLPPVSDALWLADHGGSSPLEALLPYAQCLSSHCDEACDIGRDFSCAGQYDWPATTAGTHSIRYLLQDEAGNPWVDWQVQYCLPPAMTRCDGLAGYSVQAQTDRDGFARLAVETGELSSAPVGYVSASGAGTYPYVFVLPPAAIESGYYGSELVLTKQLIDEPFVNLGGGVFGDVTDPVGSVWVFPKDCRGDSASHVTVEILPASEPGKGYQPCADCPDAIYTLDDSSPDANGRELTSSTDFSFNAGRAILADVPALNSLLIVRDSQSRRPLAAQRLTVHAGAFNIVRLYPAAKQQLGDLDAAPL